MIRQDLTPQELLSHILPSTGKDAALRDAIDRAGNVILAQEPTIGPPKDGIYTSTEFSPIAPKPCP